MFNNGKIFFQFGSTALYKAAEKGHVDVVKYLVENGADVNPTRSVRMMCTISQMRISIAQLPPKHNFCSKFSVMR
jgi:hypothetical protein